jgi:hypothetical protein
MQNEQSQTWHLVIMRDLETRRRVFKAACTCRFHTITMSGYFLICSNFVQSATSRVQNLILKWHPDKNQEEALAAEAAWSDTVTEPHCIHWNFMIFMYQSASCSGLSPFNGAAGQIPGGIIVWSGGHVWMSLIQTHFLFMSFHIMDSSSSSWQSQAWRSIWSSTWTHWSLVCLCRRLGLFLAHMFVLCK